MHLVKKKPSVSKKIKDDPKRNEADLEKARMASRNASIEFSRIAKQKLNYLVKIEDEASEKFRKIQEIVYLHTVLQKIDE
jgi:hypothetical protein